MFSPFGDRAPREPFGKPLVLSGARIPRGGSSIALLPTFAHFVAGLDVLRAPVDRDGDDQHHGEHSEQGAVCGFSARAVGQRLESADDDAGDTSACKRRRASRTC